MIRVCKAPDRTADDFAITLFMAGSIEMGKATNWQERVTQKLSEHGDLKDLDILLYNPRRDDWDSSWVQRKDNPQFNEQVTWEITNLVSSDIVIMYFDENSLSPITLLELGMTAPFKHQLIIYCPDKFWRKGNVDIVAEYFGVEVFTDEEAWLNKIVDAVKLIDNLDKVNLR